MEGKISSTSCECVDLLMLRQFLFTGNCGYKIVGYFFGKFTFQFFVVEYGGLSLYGELQKNTAFRRVLPGR